MGRQGAYYRGGLIYPSARAGIPELKFGPDLADRPAAVFGFWQIDNHLCFFVTWCDGQAKDKN